MAKLFLGLDSSTQSLSAVVIDYERRKVVYDKSLNFDRAQAQGMRLNIASGSAVRFEPGQERTVELVDYAGERTVYGFRGLTQGKL